MALHKFSDELQSISVDASMRKAKRRRGNRVVKSDFDCTDTNWIPIN